jgi:hypothetical protein
MIKPESKSSVKVYAVTDKIPETFLKRMFADIWDFGDMDFSRIDFNTLTTPRVLALNKKVKKFIYLQLIFVNDEVNENFGLYAVQLQYAIGNYVK